MMDENVYITDKKSIQVEKIAPSIYKTPCYDKVRSDGTKNALSSDFSKFSLTFTLDDWRQSETPDCSTD
jgi:hypothetical protein